jgi:phage baseplate assembly protein gpV
MTDQLTNIMRREAMRAVSQLAMRRIGIVTSYDPNNYTAKVKIQPEDNETGWLPISTAWSGNGWGDYAPPTPGDIVEVDFQEGHKGAGIVGQRHYGDVMRPLPVPSGERWIVHKSGSFLKFHNDGTVQLSAQTAINSSAPIWNHTGNMIVDGTIKATGDIWDNYLTGGYTMASFRATYDIHTHGGIFAGSSNTNVPNQIL